MNTPIPFANPYRGLPEEQTSRANADVPTDEYKMLQRILTEKGTIQTTINMLWQKLIHELRARNITDYSRASDFQDFVSRSRLVLPGEANPVDGVRSAPLRSDAEADAPANRRGTPPGSPTVPAVANVVPDVQKHNRGGQRGEKRTVKAR